MRREDPNDPGASDYSDKEAENEFVLIDQSKQNDRLIRQIEEGVYNIKREDYDPDGMLKERRRSLQIDSDSEDGHFDQKRIDQAHGNRSQSHFIRAEPRQELKD